VLDCLERSSFSISVNISISVRSVQIGGKEMGLPGISSDRRVMFDVRFSRIDSILPSAGKSSYRMQFSSCWIG
jgi:hypothetical protein